MKLLNVTCFVVLIAIIASGTTLHAALTAKDLEEAAIDSILHREDQWPSSSLAAGRRSVSGYPMSLNATCKKDPSNKEGSPGPYCCLKQCVDVKTDHGNCGSCHHKCKNKEACSKGRCVRLPPFADCEQPGRLR
ncbi:stigma-specific STIG1-like protein 2 [Aristolochia californica]|uniref:stigma-specific STIG1-like protein 2 n=1 Tax=Aristolochia californica TaxID=171875 RepID=UPI0035D5BFC2